MSCSVSHGIAIIEHMFAIDDLDVHAPLRHAIDTLMTTDDDGVLDVVALRREINRLEHLGLCAVAEADRGGPACQMAGRGIRLDRGVAARTVSDGSRRRETIRRDRTQVGGTPEGVSRVRRR